MHQVFRVLEVYLDTLVTQDSSGYQVVEDFQGPEDLKATKGYRDNQVHKDQMALKASEVRIGLLH